ncbi:MAG: hypothetical protein P1S60_13255 [Anaerolineae bacterium]|nr:hypothetical protein [Anaerolineae bacterium]
MAKQIMLLVSVLMLCVNCQRVNQQEIIDPGDAVARIVYFYAADCSLCDTVFDEILEPLLNSCGENLEIKAFQIDTDPGYEVLMDTERAMIGDVGRWDIPVVVVDDTYFIGDQAIRTGLLPHLQCVYGEGGNTWPDIPVLDTVADQSQPDWGLSPAAGEAGDIEPCINDDEAAVCASPNPIFLLYLSAEACEGVCDRMPYDLRYLRGVYPQLLYEEKDISTNIALARAIASEFDLDIADEDLAPAIVIGDHYLTGEQLHLENLKSVIGQYSETGSLAIWYTLDLE